jgi:hypothetical protein
VYASLTATAIGAALLSPLGDYVTGMARHAASAAQGLALATAFVLSLVSSRAGAVHTWRDARMRAEQQRTNLFRALLAARGPAVLPCQLGYFVAGLLDDQLGYFNSKVKQHGAFLAGIARWRYVAYAALAVIAAVTGLSVVQQLAAHGIEIPAWLAAAAAVVHPAEQTRLLSALGVVAAMVQNIATLRSQLSLAERNVERYSVMATRLQRLRDSELGDAEAAARAGRHGEVVAFAERVMTDLDIEASAWAQVRGTIAPPRKFAALGRRKAAKKS